MQRSLIFAIAGIFFLSATIIVQKRAVSQVKKDEEPFYELYEQAVNKYHHGEFDEAIRLSTMIRDEYPHEPAGAFGLMTTYQTIMRNYRVRCFEATFDSLLELSVDLAEKAAQKDKKDGRGYFYLGCAYGSRSLYNANRGDWLDAFKDGSQVMKNFKRAIAYSPEFYDAYYGLGLYKYWFGAKNKILRALPFSKNNRREGIEQIKLVMEKGRFLKVDSMYGLTAIYHNEGEYEKALEMTDRLYQEFPNNPGLLYRRGRLYQDLERWSEAREMFKQLSNLLRVAKYQSISFQIDSYFQAARCEYHLNNILEAQRLCAIAVDLEKQCDFSKELDGPFEKFSEIIDQLYTLHNEIKAIILTEASASKKN